MKTLPICRLALFIAFLCPFGLKGQYVYTSMFPNECPVQFSNISVNDSLKTVVFGYRQDTSALYGFSTDAGLTWTNSIGPLNPGFSVFTRYHNTAIYNPPGNTNPLNGKVVMGAQGIQPGPVASYSQFFSTANITAGAPAAQEQILNDVGYFAASDIAKRRPNEFWQLYARQDTMGSIDSISLYKGLYNQISGQVVWGRTMLLDLPDFSISPKIAWSPDGSIGWLSFLGDLPGQGLDSLYSPILMKSTDGGLTWSSPIEVDLRWQCMLDSLDSFFPGNSQGRPTCGFQYDLTVDINGNPHFFTGIFNNDSTQVYSLLPGLWKGQFDITTPDQGQNWQAIYLSPLYTFRGETGQNPLDATYDNEPQISRSPDGSRIFYAWIDSDTSLLGFGTVDNLSPELITVGFRLSDSMVTRPHNWSDGVPGWDDYAIFPQMANECLTQSGVQDTFILALSLVRVSFTVPPLQAWDYIYMPGIKIPDDRFTVSAFVMDNQTCGYNCGPDCVWPGDADANNVVDINDVLAVGIAFNSNGPSRANPNTLWVPQPATNWAGNLANGANYKHTDCDGNGLTEWADTNAIIQNFGLSHLKTNLITTPGANPPLIFDWIEDSVMVGDTAHLRIRLGSLQLPADSVYGIAMTLNYDPTLVDTSSATVSFDSCWIGVAGQNLLGLAVDQYFSGKLHIAVTRNNQTDTSGQGTIAIATFVMVDNIAAKQALVSRTFAVSVASARLIDHNEMLRPFSLENDSVIIYDTEGGINHDPVKNEIPGLFPNPFQNGFRLTGIHDRVKTIEVWDLKGRKVGDYTPKANEQPGELGQELPKGIYLVKIQTITSAYTLKACKLE